MNKHPSNSGALRSLAAATCVVLVVAAAGCASDGNSAGGSGDVPTVTIVADLTGPVGALGTAYSDGAQAYFKSVNYSAGGRKFKISGPIDSRSDSSAAQGAFRQAIEQRPSVMIGLSISSSVLGSQSLLDTADIPMLGATTLPQLDGGGTSAPSKWFFTAGAAGNQVVDGMVFKLGELMKGLKGKRIAIARSDSAAVESNVKVVNERAKDQEIVITADEKMTTGGASFASQAANIARTHPDGVLLFGIGNDAVTIAKALSDAGMTDVPLLQFNGGTTYALMKAVGLPNFYATFVSPEPTDESPLAKTASALGFGKNVHSANFSQGWAAAAVLTKALEGCSDPCDANAMIAALQGVTDFTPSEDSAFAPITLSGTDHVVGNAIMVYSWDTTTDSPKPAGDVVELPAFK